MGFTFKLYASTTNCQDEEMLEQDGTVKWLTNFLFVRSKERKKAPERFHTFYQILSYSEKDLKNLLADMKIMFTYNY